MKELSRIALGAWAWGQGAAGIQFYLIQSLI